MSHRDRQIQLFQRPLSSSFRRQKSRSPQEPEGFNLYFWLCWTCSTLSPVRQGNPAFYFNLPGLSCIPGTDNYLDPPPLCSITLWRVYINHRNINYLFSPGLPGTVTAPLWDYISTNAFPALIQVWQNFLKEVHDYEQNEDLSNLCRCLENG